MFYYWNAWNSTPFWHLLFCVSEKGEYWLPSKIFSLFYTPPFYSAEGHIQSSHFSILNLVWISVRTIPALAKIEHILKCFVPPLYIFSCDDFTLCKNVYFLRQRQKWWLVKVGVKNCTEDKDWGEKWEISTAGISVAEENLESLLLLVYIIPDAADCYILLHTRIQFSDTNNFVMNTVFYRKWQRIKSWIPSQTTVSN